MPLLVVEVLNREAAWTGISFAIAAVVQAIALQPVGRLTDTWGRKPVLVVGLIACGVSSAFIPFSPNIGWLTVELCVFGAGSAALSTSPTAIVGDVTRGSGGTPVAVFQMHSDLGSIIGPLAAGALAAPLAGGLADKFGAGKVTQMGAALVTLSFALMFMLPLLPLHGQLALIALSAIGFDLGLQSSLVAHQNLVYGLEPQARGRLNALLFTVVFIGMSLGSVLGSKLYVLAGWNGVVTLAVVSGAIALAIRLLENARIVAAERRAS